MAAIIRGDTDTDTPRDVWIQFRDAVKDDVPIYE
jgi:hypothetical protein